MCSTWLCGLYHRNQNPFSGNIGTFWKKQICFSGNRFRVSEPLAWLSEYQIWHSENLARFKKTQNWFSGKGGPLLWVSNSSLWAGGKKRAPFVWRSFSELSDLVAFRRGSRRSSFFFDKPLSQVFVNGFCSDGKEEGFIHSSTNQASTVWFVRRPVFPAIH